jgi:hypothetical protein
MKLLVLVVVALGLSSAGFAQRHPIQFSFPGGGRNILAPGGGHAPAKSLSGAAGSYSSGWLAPGKAADPQPSVVFVPWPVYDSGSADGNGNGQQNDPDQTLRPGLSPVPIINQSVVPPQGPLLGVVNPNASAKCVTAESNVIRPSAPKEERATIYLIALKDHSIVKALGYWMEGETLHYVSADYGLNQVSSILIDQDLSQHLNDQRGVAFKFPAPSK